MVVSYIDTTNHHIHIFYVNPSYTRVNSFTCRLHHKNLWQCMPVFDKLNFDNVTANTPADGWEMRDLYEEGSISSYYAYVICRSGFSNKY